MRVTKITCFIVGINCLGSVALAQETVGISMDRICVLETLNRLIISPQEIAICREIWRRSIANARLQAQIYRARAEVIRRRFAEEESVKSKPPGPVTVDRFFGDDLFFGDVVVTSKGPRVFVGGQGQAAEARDFVALDDPRSPHKSQAKQFEGARRP